MQLLLADSRVNPCEASNDGVTPVFVAAAKGHAEVLSLLVADPRVDPSLSRPDGLTPLFVAAGQVH